MSEANLPVTVSPDRELVKEIAMDIGKAAVSHLRIMYPKAYDALGPSGRLSMRNCIHNEIMAALSTTDADDIGARLAERKRFRRQQHAAYDRIRKARPVYGDPDA